MKKVLVIMPAFNESAGLPSLIESIAESPVSDVADLLIINDGSTDNTGGIAWSMGAQVLTNVYNMGYGASLQVGYKYAVRHGYRYVLQMDADAQHDIRNLEIMLSVMLADNTPPVDILIGSRFLDGSQSFPISRAKMIVIRIFRSVIKSTTGKVITDPTSGLQALSFRAFEYYSRYNNFHREYPDMNMIIQMLLNDFVIEEFPAIMHPRVAGKSMHANLAPILYMLKMSLGTLIVIVREKLARWNRRRKQSRQSGQAGQ